MDSDQQVTAAGLCFAVSFGVDITRFLFRQQNITLKNSVTGKITRTEAILLPSTTICPAYMSFCVCVTKKTSLICGILIFALQSSA